MGTVHSAPKLRAPKLLYTCVPRALRARDRLHHVRAVTCICAPTGARARAWLLYSSLSQYPHGTRYVVSWCMSTPQYSACHRASSTRSHSSPATIVCSAGRRRQSVFVGAHLLAVSESCILLQHAQVRSGKCSLTSRESARASSCRVVDYQHVYR